MKTPSIGLAAIVFASAAPTFSPAAENAQTSPVTATSEGFFAAPNSPLSLRFNAKPRVDLTTDSAASGNNYRFVTAMIPLEGTSEHGGGAHSNVNANATQLLVEARSSEGPGDFRFHYQNDFFGDNRADMRYRLQHLYAHYFGVTAGFTRGVFEDPDVWPDTVDYEGPNALIFARRPVVHYACSWDGRLRLTAGLEKPEVALDRTSAPDAVVRTRHPDAGFNVRWRARDQDYVQVSVVARYIGVAGTVVGKQREMAWGVNVSGRLALGNSDSVQALLVSGRGIGGLGNDAGFVASDAAFDAAGNLEALGYWSGMVAATHQWSMRWRSTATFGYVHLDNAAGQPGDAYHVTRYVSANLVCQLRDRLTLGFECLWGQRVVKSGRDGDVFRLQTGLAYALFD